MKVLITTSLFLIAAFNTGIGQVDRNQFHLRSGATGICLTPTHGVFFCNHEGEVVAPDREPGTWRQADPVPPKNGEDGLTFDDVNFFNNDTGMVSGLFYDDKGRFDTYYRTTDGGRHWEKSHFTDRGPADVVVHLNNGKAWASMAGSGHIDYSTDYGLTWQRIPIPHPKERYAQIFFNSNGEGLIGSLWNAISYTSDNGNSWCDIPTPLSQNAYQKTNIDSRPEINAVALYFSYLLIEQEGQLFVSAKDTIHWRRLPYDGFIADNNSNTLYFTRKNTVIKAAPDLSPSTIYALPGNPGIGTYNRGELVLWNGVELTRIDQDGSIRHTPLFTHAADVWNPLDIGYDHRHGSIGYQEGKLFNQIHYSDPWHYLTTLPFSVKDRALQIAGEDSLLVIGPGDSLQYYNFKTGKSSYTTTTALFTSFCSQAVQQIVFETGSQGCFHYYANDLTYKRKGDYFVLVDNKYTGSVHRDTPKGYPNKFSTATVDSFIQKLPSALPVLPTIESVGFQAADFDQARRDIQAFQDYVKRGKTDHGIESVGFRLPKNNLNFRRLLSLTDSVVTLQPKIVDSLLQYASLNGSTTTNWTGLRFLLKNGETLSVKNSYYDANSLHFPWVFNLGGYYLTRNVIAVNHFIESAYPAFLDPKTHADIVECFVKFLYGD